MSPSKVPKLLFSDDIQDPSKYWKSTICFRKFRKKLSELSKMHWTSLMGANYISEANSAIGVKDKLALTIATLPFQGRMLALDKDEMSEWLKEYENSIRNSILVLRSGNIEFYLKRSILIYLLCNGYAELGDKFKLNSVGEAIGAPVIKKSTIHKQLIYIGKLLDIDFKKHISVWEKAYKQRCILAHQAGIISGADNDDILFYDENIQTDWESLLQVLDSTNQIVGIIDQKISSSKFRLLELEFELSILKKAKKLPLKENLWIYIHNELGCNNTANEYKQKIETAIYQK
jgi:hypothetical protein